MTAVEQFQTQEACVMGEVCRLLGISQEDYAQHQYEEGTAYLNWYLATDAEARQALESSRIWWNWWRLMWTSRDQVYLEQMQMVPEALHSMKRIYRELHRATSVLIDTKPPRSAIAVITKKRKGEK